MKWATILERMKNIRSGVYQSIYPSSHLFIILFCLIYLYLPLIVLIAYFFTLVIIIIIIISGVGLSPLGTAATSDLLYKPQMIYEGDCGAIGVMKIGRGNRSTQRKPAPAPFCPPQIPHDQTRPRTRAVAVGLCDGWSQFFVCWDRNVPYQINSRHIAN
jgi:hypothetical protein